MKWGMLIDLERCVGCQTCLAACKTGNNVPPSIDKIRTVDYENGEYPDVRRTFLPVNCMQCEDPPCVDACPADATEKKENGIITVDDDKCTGCKSCIAACPYGARSFFDGEVEYYGDGPTPLERRILEENEEDTIIKCDFCMERIEKGIEEGLTPGKDRKATPLCVIACPTEARIFGNLEDPKSEVRKKIREKHGFQLHPEYETDPNVYYVR